MARETYRVTYTPINESTNKALGDDPVANSVRIGDADYKEDCNPSLESLKGDGLKSLRLGVVRTMAEGAAMRNPGKKVSVEATIGIVE